MDPKKPRNFFDESKSKAFQFGSVSDTPEKQYTHEDLKKHDGRVVNTVNRIQALLITVRGQALTLRNLS